MVARCARGDWAQTQHDRTPGPSHEKLWLKGERSGVRSVDLTLQWGRSKQDWLGALLDMENGVPSHDTFGRVFSILSPSAFQDPFVSWTRTLGLSVAGRVMTIDGKTLHRRHDRANGRAAIRMVYGD